MPEGTFKFVFEDKDKTVLKEFTVLENADIDTVLESFATFLSLCGWAFDDQGGQN